jgi:hypothetical protein
MKKILLTVLIVLLIFCTIIIFSNQSKIAALLLSRLSSQSAKSGIIIQSQSPSFAFWGVKSTQTIITARIGKLLLHLPFKDLAVKTRPLELLFSSNKSANISAQLYEGDLTADIKNINAGAKTLEVSAELSKLNLGSIELLRIVGIESGLISLTINQLALSKKNLSGNFQLNINNFNKPIKNQLPSYLTGLPLQLEIPEISNLNASMDLEIKPRELLVKKLELTSSLLTVKQFTGSTSFQSLNLKRPNKLSYKGSFTLTEAGLTTFGPYLNLLGAKPIANQELTFTWSQTFGTEPNVHIRFY